MINPFHNKINGNVSPMYGEENHLEITAAPRPILNVLKEPVDFDVMNHAFFYQKIFENRNEAAQFCRQKNIDNHSAYFDVIEVQGGFIVCRSGIPAERAAKEFAKKQPALVAVDTSKFSDNPVVTPHPHTEPQSYLGEAAKFSLDQFSIINNLDAMKAKMLNDVFVLYGIALLGQLTAIYAKPNTGKTLLTLWMLIESIKAGRIKGENVYYINADDTYKGLVTKGEVAKKYGIRMIVPNENGFKAEDFCNHLRQLITDDSANGVIIVLDTLKKFTDLMDKKKGSQFMKTAREFAQKGGTMIMLAHTNKNRSLDGKVVAGGTSDIGDDCDCAYTLDEVQGNSKTHKDVLFENFKSRGNVKKELLATYAQSDNPTISNYHDLFNSVQIVNDGDIEQAKKERELAIKLTKDKDAIDAITDAINQGNHKRLEIVDYAMKAHGVTRRKTKEVIDNYTGTKLSNSSLWRLQLGEKNSQIYYLLKNENDSPEEYENAKNG